MTAVQACGPEDLNQGPLGSWWGAAGVDLRGLWKVGPQAWGRREVVVEEGEMMT